MTRLPVRISRTHKPFLDSAKTNLEISSRAEDVALGKIDKGGANEGSSTRCDFGSPSVPRGEGKDYMEREGPQGPDKSEKRSRR